MKVRIRKEEINLLLVDEKNQIIESYSFEQEINFKGAVTFLLKQNLIDKIEIIDEVKEKTEAEENLIKILSDIFSDYNKKVEEFGTLKKTLDNKNAES